MKKIKIVLAICSVALGLSLVGCSKKKIDVKVVDGVIKNDTITMDIKEFRGASASTDIGDGLGTIEYYLCNTQDHCEHNTANVLVEDMSKYKKCQYYTLYHETNIYLYVPYGKQYIECLAKLNDVGVMNTEVVLQTMYKTAKKLTLSTELKSVNYENRVDVNVSGFDFKLRSNELVIPQYMRVKLDDGSVVTKESVTINGVTVGKKSTNKYDYYQGNGVIIQVVAGTDISSIVTFK